MPLTSSSSSAISAGGFDDSFASAWPPCAEMLRTTATTSSSGRVTAPDEGACPEHRGAERQQHQRERHRVVAGRLQPQRQQRLLDEHLPAERRHHRRRDEACRVRELRRSAGDSGRCRWLGLRAGADERILRQGSAAAVNPVGAAGVDDAVVLIEDRDRGVGESAEVGGEALELRQVERPAGDAGHVAVGVYASARRW